MVQAAVFNLESNFILTVTIQRFLPLTSLEVILAKDCEECMEASVKNVEECINL